MFPPAMSSHFLLQHVQIFLAKNARRQPTGMTKRTILGGTETLPSIYALNQQKPKWFLHHSFTSKMWNTHHLTCTSEGNPTPSLPTISVAYSATPLHYVHRGLGLKLILQSCTWRFPAFLGPCSNFQLFSDKSQCQQRNRNTSSSSWERRKDKDRIETTF